MLMKHLNVKDWRCFDDFHHLVAWSLLRKTKKFKNQIIPQTNVKFQLWQLLWRRLTWYYKPITRLDSQGGQGRLSKERLLKCMSSMTGNQPCEGKDSIPVKKNTKIKKAVWQECILFPSSFLSLLGGKMATTAPDIASTFKSRKMEKG